MRDVLLTLRKNSYEAADDFYCAKDAYISLLLSNSKNALQEAIGSVRVTGEKYLNELQALLNFLRDHDRSVEIERRQKLIEILEREIKLVAWWVETQ